MPEAEIFCHRFLQELMAHVTGHLASRSELVARASGFWAEGGNALDLTVSLGVELADVFESTVPLAGAVTSAVAYCAEIVLDRRAARRSRAVTDALPSTYEELDALNRQVVFEVLLRYLVPLHLFRAYVAEKTPTQEVPQKMIPLMTALATYGARAVKKGMVLWSQADATQRPPLETCLPFAPIYADVADEDLLKGIEHPVWTRSGRSFFRSVDVEVRQIGKSGYYRNTGAANRVGPERPYRQGYTAEIGALQRLQVSLEADSQLYGQLLVRSDSSARCLAGQHHPPRNSYSPEGVSLENREEEDESSSEDGSKETPTSSAPTAVPLDLLDERITKVIALLREEMTVRSGCCSGGCTLL